MALNLGHLRPATGACDLGIVPERTDQEKTRQVKTCSVTFRGLVDLGSGEGQQDDMSNMYRLETSPSYR